jgi:outer membrane protein assembly factor BamB
MHILNNRTTATLIALFLLLSITVTSVFVALPTVVAHDPPWIVPTNAYVSLSPSTVGVGQYTSIVVWLDRYSPTAGGGIGQRWDGFQIDIIQPDGTNVTFGPFQCISDVAADSRSFTPDAVGTYTIYFHWPGETVKASPAVPTSISIGDFYAGSTSAPAYLTVQQDPVATWQEPPIPTDYWEWPINDLNRGWSMLASNWLGGSAFGGAGGWNPFGWQPAGTGPESAHIMWTAPIEPARSGGILDAQWPGITSNPEDYEQSFQSQIIMNGKIYYNAPAVGDSVQYGYYCRDLYTGEIIWYKNGTDNGFDGLWSPSAGAFGGGVPALSRSYPRLTNGQLYHWYGVNGNGVLSYLWMQSGTTWYMFDAATGNWMLTLINVPSGTGCVDENGDLLLYSYNPSTGNILCWNSSQAIYPGGAVGTTQQQWKPRLAGVIDAVNDTSWYPGAWSASLDPAVQEAMRHPHSGYTMNVTIQAGLPVSAAYGASSVGFSAVLQDDNRVPKQLFGFSSVGGSSIGANPSADTFNVWLVDINEHAADYSPYPGLPSTWQNNLGFTATLKYSKTLTVPLPGMNYTWNLGGVSYNDQVFILTCKQTGQIWGYDLSTGSVLWGPNTPPTQQMYFYGLSTNIYYGKVLATYNYVGEIMALDAKTGEQLWTWNSTTTPYESPYGDNQPTFISCVCDGKIYTYTSEHSPTKPNWRGSYIHCVNATDGTEIWKLLNYAVFLTGYGIADGYIVTASDYDNLIYCIGKGPSATTVSAPQTSVTMGSTAVITGTVNDICSGAMKNGPIFGYTNGIPAISDESQEAWMEYIYQQQAKPTDATGVPVSIDAIDPNGNLIHIGDATSDASGTFGYSWTTPDVPGQYRIIASFKGSSSYGSSSASTYAYVGEEAPTASPPPTQAQSPTEMYFALSTAAIIIAIVIVGIVVVLMLRKRP